MTDVLQHQDQYGDSVADFFAQFNAASGRDMLFSGYLRGYLTGRPDLTGDAKIAADFGCGTGWFMPHLARAGFARVYGIDTAQAMIDIAAATHRDNPALLFMATPPAEIIGGCDLVTAVHVHYHFTTYDELKTLFFAKIAALLRPGGEVLLIGCPSDFVHARSDHCQNYVALADLPAHPERPDLIAHADAGDFVPLAAVPWFKMKDGTQMKVKLRMTGTSREAKEMELRDTFWTDATLHAAAQSCGLALTQQSNLDWRGETNVYAIMHFRKRAQ